MKKIYIKILKFGEYGLFQFEEKGCTIGEYRVILYSTLYRGYDYLFGMI